MKRILPLLMTCVIAASLLACGSPGKNGKVALSTANSDSISRARQDSINRTLPGYVVDSILPVDEELRRFRDAVGGDSLAAFSGGSTTRDALVSKLVHSLAASDTTALQKMLLNVHEFAWLVYPESPYTHAPYTQSPALVWNQIQNPGVSGLTRLLRRLAGKRLELAGYRCDSKSDHQGANTIWTGCLVRISESGQPERTRRLFGSIIERHGQFKFVSYVNEF